MFVFDFDFFSYRYILILPFMDNTIILQLNQVLRLFLPFHISDLRLSLKYQPSARNRTFHPKNDRKTAGNFLRGDIIFPTPCMHAMHALKNSKKTSHAYIISTFSPQPNQGKLLRLVRTSEN